MPHVIWFFVGFSQAAIAYAVASAWGHPDSWAVSDHISIAVAIGTLAAASAAIYAAIEGRRTALDILQREQDARDAAALADELKVREAAMCACFSQIKTAMSSLHTSLGALRDFFDDAKREDGIPVDLNKRTFSTLIALAKTDPKITASLPLEIGMFGTNVRQAVHEAEENLRHCNQFFDELSHAETTADEFLLDMTVLWLLRDQIFVCFEIGITLGGVEEQFEPLEPVTDVVDTLLAGTDQANGTRKQRALAAHTAIIKRQSELAAALK